uniref:TonB C-terminal domain-containing protein n=1 Tax=Phenylobacterium glaciei TaxID=2803784 RepID=A0A974S9P7_9CAUL|nr:hypothetical protein JKL49_12300 [Phenylobacterium glaciei]
MLLSVLALTAALSAPSASAPASESAPALAANAYIVECLVAGPSLTACTVIDADPATNPDAATALKLAANIHVRTPWLRPAASASSSTSIRKAFRLRLTNGSTGSKGSRAHRAVF